MGSNPSPAVPGGQGSTTPTSTTSGAPVGAGTSPADSPAAHRELGSGKSRRPLRPEVLYAVVTVVIAVVVVVAAIAIVEGRHHTSGSSSGQVVTAAGTIYYITVGQYNAISVDPDTPSVIAGSFKCTYPVVLYTMDTQQFEALVTHNEVNYTWTSGQIQNYTVYHFSAPVAAGAWSLVFIDPSKINPVTVVFYSNVTLGPS